MPNLKHSVYDCDTHFSVNPVTRVLQNESTGKTGVIQYDHNSERFTFEIPRMIEGHDMSQCDVIQVHYNNIDAQTKQQNRGVYEVDDMQISPDGDDVVILSWLISQNATRYVGGLHFLIRFSCTSADGTMYYVWNTAIYSGISVSSGINNGEFVVEQYADILNEWKNELEANQIVSLTQTQASTEDEGVNVWTATFGDGRTENLEVKNGSKGDKPVKGVDYWTPTDKAEIMNGTSAPTYAATVADMTDTSKVYLGSNGNLWAYTCELVEQKTNQYNASTAQFNTRWSFSNNSINTGSTAQGCVLIHIDGLELDNKNSYVIKFSGVTLAENNSIGYGQIVLFNSAGTRVGNYYIRNNGDNSNIILCTDSDGYYIELMSKAVDITAVNCDVVLAISTSTIIAADCANLFVEFVPMSTYSEEYNWHDTGKAYTSYAFTDADADRVADKVLDRLDVSYVSTDKVLTVGQYTFRYDGEAVADIGVTT